MKKIILNAILLFSFCLLSHAQLFVGANYHPHDVKNAEKWDKDIALMKEAGFKVVRMGHLAWDSYEPTEGNFDFKWFDEVMDKMDRAGIKVILDIAVKPAPIWLHHKYPSIDVTDFEGKRLYPNRRYMEDTGDADYQRYALRYTDELTKHYAHHPALLAFGIDNETGDGQLSYSESVRQRFIVWLKSKYGNVNHLNEAWAGQRWSRKISDFDEVGLPLPRYGGAPERQLDFHRFVSSELNGFLMTILDKVHENAPNVLTTTNAWYYSYKYFDYPEIAYSGKMSREGCGFYPGNSLLTNRGLNTALFGIARIQFESDKPFWCNEFVSMTAVPKSIRKAAYATLMLGNQLVCGWTWQGMQGGEEQYLEGLLDWDGTPNRKYDEYKQIAAEFKKINNFFPYRLHAKVGLAYSFESQMVSNNAQVVSNPFPVQHDTQLQTCFEAFNRKNIDVKVLDMRMSSLNYNVLVIPGVAVMTKEMADKIRSFVKNGGTVIMTSNSALVQDNGQVFSTIHPAYLNDVFGIRIASYEETDALNELSRMSYVGNKMEVTYRNAAIQAESARFDVIEPKGASVIGNIVSLDKDYPIITYNKYGKGEAYYIGLPASDDILNRLIDDLEVKYSLRNAPEVPDGIMARYTDKKHILLLNTTVKPQSISIGGSAKSLLFDREYQGNFLLQPFEPEFLAFK